MLLLFYVVSFRFMIGHLVKSQTVSVGDNLHFVICVTGNQLIINTIYTKYIVS